MFQTGEETRTYASKFPATTRNQAELRGSVLVPVLVLTCRYLTGDRRSEKQESREYGEKCIHVPGRVRVSVSSSFPPSKVSPLEFVRVPFSLRLCLVAHYSSGCCTEPLHSPLSPLSLFSLPTGSRGHHTLSHAERGSARVRARRGESERSHV